jgi:hypothetical protein
MTRACYAFDSLCAGMAAAGWKNAGCNGHPPMPRLQALPMFLAVALAVGCATPPPQPGTERAEVLRTWGPPTATYALAAGAQRLEYATGPYGRTTWMIELDAGGRVTRARQVLNEAEFLAVQSAPELRREDLLRWLGTPGERKSGGRAGGQVWSWRYPTNDCLWFQSSVADDGRVTGSAYNIDPTCDKPGDRE